MTPAMVPLRYLPLLFFVGSFALSETHRVEIWREVEEG